jgi:hypothetical protein
MCALLIAAVFLSAAGFAGKGVGEPCSPDALVAVVDVVAVLLESVPDVLACCANPAGANISASAATPRILTRPLISILLNLNSGAILPRNETRLKKRLLKMARIITK